MLSTITMNSYSFLGERGGPYSRNGPLSPPSNHSKAPNPFGQVGIYTFFKINIDADLMSIKECSEL